MPAGVRLPEGVRVVGAAGPVPPPARSSADPVGEDPADEGPGDTRDEVAPDTAAAEAAGAGDPTAAEVHRLRRRLRLAVLVAAAGLAGTVGFALAWAGGGGTSGSQQQVTAASRTFLLALTNFTAKSVDRDFATLTSMATGQFATQADRFFNSAIRQELESALAQSNGQIRDLYVQSIDGDQATVYAVVDQLFVNNKVSSPQSDVLRVVIGLRQVGGSWKIASVSVLEGPSPSGGGTTTTTPTP